MAAERKQITWVLALNEDMPLSVMLNTLPTKGNLVYEYNPFRNYRLTKNKYFYKGSYYSVEDMEREFKLFPYYLKQGVITKWNLDSTEIPIGWATYKDDGTYEKTRENPELYEKGLLIDFITDELKVSLDHPVHIIPLYSYDGSVNLILNDGLNKPRLINSRFSATGMNTYEIVDRKGSNDTNIYDLGEQFDIDTSLYKIVNSIPEIKFLRVSSGGNLKVGNYHFYFRLADSDGNETDFVAESGLVSVFLGEGSYESVHTGTKNQNSTKLVEFGISNIDSAYDYIIVYYSRSTAEFGDNSITEYVKINKKFNRINSKLVITGFEETENITVLDINVLYNIVNSAHTSAVCQNMLFMGNVKKQDIPYEELLDLSLRILPYLGTEVYEAGVKPDYSVSKPKKSYTNANFIYEKTGYWPGEFYRFGIVYILPNGLLTPVFNVRGAYNITNKEEKGFLHVPIEKEGERYMLKYNDSNFLVSETEGLYKKYVGENECENVSVGYSFDNVKGVCSFDPKSYSSLTDIDIYYVNFCIPEEVKEELKKYIKGYFFVRQTRMPLKVALGITIGVDTTSRTPTIPTMGGILSTLENVLEKTHVETENINGINYITEGFLKRHSFRFKLKKSAIWKKIGKVMGVAALVVAAVACALIPGGLIVAIAEIAGLVIGASTTLGGLLLGAAIVGAAGVVAGVAASTLELGYAVIRIGAKKRLNGKATVAPSGYEIVPNDDARQLTKNFEDRIIIKDGTRNDIHAIICPDYTLNQPYYNQIFTGNTHHIETDVRQSNKIDGFEGEHYFENDNDRHFYISEYLNRSNNDTIILAKVIGVADNINCVGIDNILFRSRAGEAEEAWRYRCIGEEITALTEDSYQKINTDIVRGSYSPYLGFINSTIGPAKIVNIYMPGYDPSNILEYMEIRMYDNSTYYAISDRFDINAYESKLLGDKNSDKFKVHKVYRGDCYICQYTQRIIRNFNDPSAPYNDDIIDINTWRDNYDPDNAEKYEQINLGDVNAVPLGMWVTFQVRSSNNLNIRTLDGSDVDEMAMTGHERGYYPIHPMSTDGSYKKPESLIYNKGFAKSVSDRWNFELPDVPHIKNWFGTRIMYSDIHINDGYKNGFRVFKGLNYRDYTREYGSIVKLISFESSLLCVFEHGIALIPVNERAVAGQGAGGNVYINTSNVLPENPKIISDMFGSQWPESVLKVPGRSGDSPLYVYGVDTIAKKIWRTDGNSIECISDFKVQEFLNNNITLGERELTPKIGIRNVKTVYNAFKRDVMFTFYDNTYGCEEKVWNLCWNELLQKFITFYSWVPSHMENINNIPFSFDRNTSKWIAKLGVSHSENSFADGITLTNVIIEDSFRSNGAAVENTKIPISYITKYGETKTIYADVSESLSFFNGKEWEYSEKGLPKFIAGLLLSNRILPDKLVHYRIDYELLKDPLRNHELFRIVPIKDYTCIKEDGSTYKISGEFTLPDDAMFPKATVPVYALCFNEGDSEWLKVYYKDGEDYKKVNDGVNPVYIYKLLYKPQALYSELYYRNSAGHAYADYDNHKLGTEKITETNLPKYQIKDLETLAQLEALVQSGKLSPDTFIGHTGTLYNLDNPPSNLIPCVRSTNISNIRDLIVYDADGTPRVHGILLSQHWTIDTLVSDSERTVWYELPIYKDITGKRPMLPKKQQVNPDKLVTLINIKATISIIDSDNNDRTLSDLYYDNKAKYVKGSSLINAGYYESTVAIAPRWNLQFLTSDFWKHGLAGIIDITDEIYPTYWYGKQHPFEFEVVVVNDPSVHKIFSNLELVANKAKPESFHYEIVGECYDFAKDKPNMYFRLEALKALWQYNGADISYNRDFLKVLPKQLPKSADFPHRYYTRQDTINNIEDYYISVTYPKGYDYRHLSGAEIVRYPNRQEYRIWNHTKAVCLDDLNQDDARSIIAANCLYLEDRWKVTINPILVCYRNEYEKKFLGSLILPLNSLWVKSVGGESLPRLPIYNSPIPDKVLQLGEIRFPDSSTGEGKDNALYELYEDIYNALDTTNWLNTPDTYGYVYSRKHYTEYGKLTHIDYYDTNGLIVRRDYYDNQGKVTNTEYARSYGANNRKEVDVKDKFMKVRIRYSGEELAIIDCLNTIYRISYA